MPGGDSDEQYAERPPEHGGRVDRVHLRHHERLNSQLLRPTGELTEPAVQGASVQGYLASSSTLG